MLRSTIIICGVLLLMTAQCLAEEVHEYQLDNGLKILLKENHSAPVVNLNVVYRVGSKYERPGITGISHLLEHMMFKTTENLPLGEFDQRLKEVGADNNAYTWLDQTVYYELIAADKVDVALELEAERMRGLLCLPIDHELEMTVVRNELEQRDDTPFTLLYEELLTNAFKAHPYAVPTIGWVDDVEGITTEEIKAYYDRFYHPDNAFLVVVGDFVADEMLEKIKQYFGHLPRADVKLPRLPQEPVQQGERRFEINRSGMVDYVLAGWHIPPSEHEDAYALEVLGNILGSGRTSRLYSKLVDTGQCAAAMSWSSAFGYQDPFLFLTGAVINPGVDPQDVEQVFYSELERIAADGVTEEELNRAKKQARVSFVYEKDSIVSEAKALVDFELMSSWRDLEAYLPGIEAVANEDLIRVASTYFGRNNRTVGTYLAIQPEEQDLVPAAAPLPAAGDDELPVPAAPQYKPTLELTSLSRGAAQVNLDVNNTEAVEIHELPNGLTVVILENHNNSTINLSGLIQAGKIDDPADLPGVGNFVVNMLSRGTEEMSKLELAAVLENNGIEMGFSPSREDFTFTARSLTEDFNTLLDLLAAQLLSSTFPEEEIEKTRIQIGTGLRDSLQDTFDQAFYSARTSLYGEGHPFSGRVEGSLASVEAISRADLVAWYEANLVPEGAIITIVGDIDAEEALAAIKLRFGSWRGSREGRAELLARGGEFQAVSGVRQDINLTDKSNVSLQWMHAGPAKGSGNWAARTVANFVFGGGFYSRLNERLRVKEGLTYGAFSWFSHGRAAGPWCISAQVNPASVEAALAVAGEELALYADQGVTPEELRMAKNYLTGNFPVKLSTNGAVAAALTDSVYLGRGTGFIRDYPAQIAAVALEEVNAEIEEYMDPAECLIVVVGTIQ